MRARTIREGSVGLLILVGIGLFGLLILWLRGLNPTNRAYRLIVEFKDTAGMQIGTAVMYRGVPVGRVTSIDAQANVVEVGVEITQSELRMPASVLVETIQSGLIGETSIEITPLEQLAAAEVALSPAGRDCDSTVILCDGDRLEGITGASYEELLRSAEQIADVLAEPDLADQARVLLENASTVTENVVELTEEVTVLTQAAQQEIGPLSSAIQQTTSSATSTAQQLEIAAAELTDLLGSNRVALVSTLNNFQVTSEQLRTVVDQFGPSISNVNTEQLVSNLEQLSANAAAASEDLSAITGVLNTPTNVILIQQTLESARDVFQSAQKLLADVDDLTGDPSFRDGIRDLVDGLSGLVSSSQQLEQQTEFAQLLEQAQQASLQPDSAAPALSPDSNAASQTESNSSGRPVLVFDGQRYVLQIADSTKAK
ncbi:MCE family protein [Romeria aff. gracilis LEGE 07310]|uniref:MCE family protein n=1 Tax=Vasconcelosia minhoensis LEGE 07310 TaxID=915328 RepID=A0A8J7DDE9_9CYAN|nr:MlaD family protein [Romeria gracilis]MBE9079807.1 MCE family protein [Romeria aff. gracilis LEGE 07310]